jgi:hypothetical protein
MTEDYTGKYLLCAPGLCNRCGHDTREDDGYKERDTGGFCWKCHNLNCDDRDRIMKAQKERGKERGIQYWQERGISTGDDLKRFCVSWTGLGGETAYGKAKVGKNGAYVLSPYQPGKLAPEGWVKV